MPGNNMNYEPSPEEIRRAEEMMTPEQRELSLDRERYLQGLKYTKEKYPDLAQQIERSLETPQLGKHHNEGSKMNSHLSLILKTLDAIKEGKFHEALAEQKEIQNIMKEIVAVPNPENPNSTTINPNLIIYTFLHDISKPDCLLIKVEGEKEGKEIDWEQWQEIERNGQPYQFEGKPIVSISYYHPSKGADGQHGNMAAEMLKNRNVPSEIIAAISKHEVAYQFSKTNAATYEEHFVKPGFSEDQQRFILVASYIDTMASLLPDGKVDLRNFINLLNSRANYLLIQEYIDKGVTIKENDLANLKKQNRLLTPEDIEKKIQKEVRYNLQRLEQGLDTLIANGTLTPEDKEFIISTLENPDGNALQSLGRGLKSKMRFVRPLLEQSKE